MNLWDWFVVLVNGKDVAVLGPRLSGKTHLYHVLVHGRVPDQRPEQTMLNEPTQKARRAGLNIHCGVDVPGAERSYPDWERQFHKSEIVFYLFDAHKIRLNSTYVARVAEDGKRMREWGRKSKGGGPRIYLLGTHADTDPECRRLGPAKYADMILDLDAVNALFRRVDAKGQEVTSLLTEKGTVSAIRSLIGK